MTIRVYVDGSVRPTNPGHTGSGALIIKEYDYKNATTQEEVYAQALLLVAKNFGKGTNNTAELNAVRIGARMVLRLRSWRVITPGEMVRFYSDSMYTVNGLSGLTTSHKNSELISKIKKELAQLIPFECVHVKGHEGHFGNEVAHSLANTAAKEGYREGCPWFGGLYADKAIETYNEVTNGQPYYREVSEH